MPPFQFFWQYRKLTLTLVLCAIVLSAAITKFGLKPLYEQSIFLSIGFRQPASAEPTELWTTANDYITESIQGWMVDPGFKKDVPYDFLLTVRKQEKQNLLVSVTAADPETAEKAVGSVMEHLQGAIAGYNAATNGTVAITHTTQSQSVVTQSLTVNIAVSVLGTLIAMWLIGSFLAVIKFNGSEQ